VFYVTKKDAKEFEEYQIKDKYGWYTMIRDWYEFQRQPWYWCIEELPRKQLFTYICDYGTRHEWEARCNCYHEFNKKSHYRFWDFLDSVEKNEWKYADVAKQFNSKFPNFVNENITSFGIHNHLVLAKIDTKVKKEIANYL
jgi:hypothetical protein